jgi:DHA2 family multidrug resistance protein
MNTPGAGAQLLGMAVQQQATVNAFVSTFWLMTVSFVAILPLLLLIRPAKPGAAPPPIAAE